MFGDECIAISSTDEEDNVQNGTQNQDKGHQNKAIHSKSKEIGFSPNVKLKEDTGTSTTTANGYHVVKRITPVLISSPVKPPWQKSPSPVPSTSSANLKSCNPNSALFEKFICVCDKKDSSSLKDKIIKKLCKAYNSTNAAYKESSEFQLLLTDQLESACHPSFKVYVSIKNVMDELKFNKKKKNVAPLPKKVESVPTSTVCSVSELTQGNDKVDEKRVTSQVETQEQEGPYDDSDCDSLFGFDDEKRRKIRKLEKTLRALHKAIAKLEMKEVKWEKEDDSTYLMMDRFRARFTKVYEKVCELRNKAPDADRPIKRKVTFQGSGYPDVDRYVEKMYNRSRKFPDFHDILEIVKEVKKKENFAPDKLHKIAEKVFKEFGTLLKIRRQRDDYDVMCSYMPTALDPASNNPELDSKLKKNFESFQKKEEEVINRYAEQELQSGMKPEVVEGSGDEQPNDGDNEEDKDEEEEEEESDDDLTADEIEEEDTDSDSEEDDEENEHGDSNSGEQKEVVTLSDNSDDDNCNDHSKKSEGKRNKPRMYELSDDSNVSSSSISKRRKIDFPDDYNSSERDTLNKTDNNVKNLKPDSNNDNETELGKLKNHSIRNNEVETFSSRADELFPCISDELKTDNFTDNATFSTDNAIKPSEKRNIKIEKESKNGSFCLEYDNKDAVKTKGSVLTNFETKKEKTVSEKMIKDGEESNDQNKDGNRLFDYLKISENTKKSRQDSSDDDCIIESVNICTPKKFNNIDTADDSSKDIDIVFDGKTDDDEVRVITAQKKIKRSQSKVDEDVDSDLPVIKIENKITLSYRQPKLPDLVKPIATSTPKKKPSPTVNRTNVTNNRSRRRNLNQLKLSQAIKRPNADEGPSNCTQTAKVILNGKRAEYISKNSAKNILSMGNTKVFTKGVKNCKNVNSDEIITVD